MLVHILGESNLVDLLVKRDGICVCSCFGDGLDGSQGLAQSLGYLSEPKETGTLILFEDFNFSMSISRQISVSKLQYQNMKCFQYLP